MSDADAHALTRSARGLALLAQLGILVNGLVLVPLIARLTGGKTDDFVRLHATEALNLHLAILIWMLTFFVAVFLGGAGMTVWIIVLLAAYLYAIVVGVIGGVKAWKGQVWTYPLNIRIMST